MKIIVTYIPVSYKLAFITFLPFRINQKQESFFRKLVVWWRKYFSFLSIASTSKHAKFNKGIFLYVCCSCSFTVPSSSSSSSSSSHLCLLRHYAVNCFSSRTFCHHKSFRKDYTVPWIPITWAVTFL